jgi:hypothetical protein
VLLCASIVSRRLHALLLQLKTQVWFEPVNFNHSQQLLYQYCADTLCAACQLHAMQVELEGLHALGIDFMGGVFLERAILRRDYI